MVVDSVQTICYLCKRSHVTIDHCPLFVRIMFKKSFSYNHLCHNNAFQNYKKGTKYFRPNPLQYFLVPDLEVDEEGEEEEEEDEDEEGNNVIVMEEEEDVGEEEEGEGEGEGEPEEK